MVSIALLRALFVRKRLSTLMGITVITICACSTMSCAKYQTHLLKNNSNIADNAEYPVASVLKELDKNPQDNSIHLLNANTHDVESVTIKTIFEPIDLAVLNYKDVFDGKKVIVRKYKHKYWINGKLARTNISEEYLDPKSYRIIGDRNQFGRFYKVNKLYHIPKYAKAQENIKYHKLQEAKRYSLMALDDSYDSKKIPKEIKIDSGNMQTFWSLTSIDQEIAKLCKKTLENIGTASDELFNETSITEMIQCHQINKQGEILSTTISVYNKDYDGEYYFSNVNAQ